MVGLSAVAFTVRMGISLSSAIPYTFVSECDIETKCENCTYGTDDTLDLIPAYNRREDACFL